MRVAAYARYSSDQQSASSISDQLRNCRVYCDRQGWPEPAVYSDAAMSGSRIDRPSYQQLLAEAGRFDVIVVDDLSRLARDSIEVAQTVRRLSFAGIRLIGVSDGVDTGRKSHKADVGLRGLIGEIHLDDLRDKTHRGLTGRALSGASAGGLPYGYRVTVVGQRAIDEAQAGIVRRIFADYLRGESARRIAGRLNADGVAAPRGGTWAASAIHGDARRGIGILANPIYCGRMVWNRSQWVKHPETGRRVRRERPESDWIVVEHPELAIVDLPTWDAAQDRLGRRGRDTGRNRGRPSTYLLSGILRCGECGGPMVIVDRYRYGCATAKDRGTCSSRLRFARKPAEDALLAGIRSKLLTAEAFQRFERAVRSELKRSAPTEATARKRLADAERVHVNILSALRAGIITPSTRAELLAAEASLESARQALASVRSSAPANMLPRARDAWRRIVSELSTVSVNLPAARQAIRQLLGDCITVRNDNGQPIAELAGCQISVVAGASSVHYLTEPTRIPLGPASYRQAGLPAIGRVK